MATRLVQCEKLGNLMRLAVNTLRSATICWVVVVIGVQSLVADEPAARFVNALREKGYYDIALEYLDKAKNCLLYTSPSPRDLSTSRMPSSA